jgi:hypothetical protein
MFVSQTQRRFVMPILSRSHGIFFWQMGRGNGKGFRLHLIESGEQFIYWSYFILKFTVNSSIQPAYICECQSYAHLFTICSLVF